MSVLESKKVINQAVLLMGQEILKELRASQVDRVRVKLMDDNDVSIADQQRAVEILAKDEVISDCHPFYPLGIMRIAADQIGMDPLGYTVSVNRTRLEKTLIKAQGKKKSYNKAQKSRSSNIDQKISFDDKTGAVSFGGLSHTFESGEIAYALLATAFENHGNKLSEEVLVSMCDKHIGGNGRITNLKQLRDALKRIREALEVSQGEWFPLQFKDKRLTWEEG